MGGEAVNHGRMDLTEPQRTPAAYRRDLLLPRQVVAQLTDRALEADGPLRVEDLPLAAAALDALWDGPDRVDIHFWHVAGTSARLQVRDRSY